MSIDSKCSKTIYQKGNALLELRRFDEAKEFYELLRSLGDAATADAGLKKLQDIQERDKDYTNVFNQES